uniref:Uncharacterized protein n=1 Tax=Arundo donax TaxID=35708 RepID=A0A0A8Y028_ARUDO
MSVLDRFWMENWSMTPRTYKSRGLAEPMMESISVYTLFPLHAPSRQNPLRQNLHKVTFHRTYLYHLSSFPEPEAQSLQTSHQQYHLEGRPSRCLWGALFPPASLFQCLFNAFLFSVIFLLSAIFPLPLSSNNVSILFLLLQLFLPLLFLLL